jgi:hypothetical protein
VCPTRTVVDREFTIRAVFPVAAVNQLDAGQLAWWGSMSQNERDNFVVDVRVEHTKAFDLSQERFSLNLESLKRVISAEFLARAVTAGRHSLRVVLRYPGGPSEIVFTRTVNVRSRAADMIQKIGVTIGAVVGLLTFLKLVHVL